MATRDKRKYTIQTVRISIDTKLGQKGKKIDLYILHHFLWPEPDPRSWLVTEKSYFY
jgi:hypothetical protein